MKHIYIQNESKQLVHCIIGIKTGWRNEYPGVYGITHLMEHAIFLGNSRYPNPDEYAFKYGVILNGMTLPEHTLFTFTSSNKDFNVILQMFKSLIFNPTFNEKKIEEEKNNNILPCVIQESDFLPYELAEEWLQNLIFEWDFRKSLGTKEDLSNITIDDLMKWHKRYFTPSNAFILAYGGIPGAQIISDYSPKVEFEKTTSIRDDREKVINKDNMDTIEVAYGYPIDEFDVAFELLRIILGNNPASKLWRQDFKKYAFVVNSKIKWTYTGGAFIISFGLAKKQDIDIIENNLRCLFETFSITEDELRIAKNILRINLFKMKEGGEGGLFKFFLHNKLGGYKDFDDIAEKACQVNKDDIYKIIEKVFSKDNQYKVVVGSV